MPLFVLLYGIPSSMLGAAPARMPAGAQPCLIQRPWPARLGEGCRRKGQRFPSPKCPAPARRAGHFRVPATRVNEQEGASGVYWDFSLQGHPFWLDTMQAKAHRFSLHRKRLKTL